jgi:hypothetical protein
LKKEERPIHPSVELGNIDRPADVRAELKRLAVFAVSLQETTRLEKRY